MQCSPESWYTVRSVHCWGPSGRCDPLETGGENWLNYPITPPCNRRALPGYTLKFNTRYAGAMCVAGCRGIVKLSDG